MTHQVIEFELKNGAKGLVINVPGSGVVNLMAVFNSGFIFGDHNKYELPHVMEHLMGSGNKLYPTARKFKIEVEKNGAYRNAYTSPYTNAYVYECAAFESERILELMAAQISRPLFPAQSFPTEISNVREELSRNTSNYDRMAYTRLTARTMPLSRMEEERRIEQLPQVERQDVVDYYQRTHTAKNLRLFLAGDFKDGGRQMIRQLEQQLSFLAPGQRLEPPPEPSVAPVAPLIVKQPIRQIYYRVHSYAGQLSYADRLPLILLSELFTGGYRSWIYGTARERGWAYAVGSEFAYEPSISYFSLYSYVTPEQSRNLFGLFAEQWARAKAGRFTTSDLKSAQDLLVGQVTRAYQTAGDMLNWYIGAYNSEAKILDFDQHLSALRQVTKAQVVAAARQVTATGRYGVSLVGEVTKQQGQELFQLLQPIWH